MRRIDMIEWCGYRGLVDRPELNRALKCITINQNVDVNKKGMVAVGTSYGEVIVMDVGARV